jgi:hypothetical protein
MKIFCDEKSAGGRVREAFSRVPEFLKASDEIKNRPKATRLVAWAGEE